MADTRLGLAIVLVLGLARSPVPAQSPSPVGTPVPQDTLQASPVKPLPATGQSPADTTRRAASGQARDTLAIRPKSRGDSVIVVKHEFNHKEQIITGSVIMTCLALMLVAMNNYNPR